MVKAPFIYKIADIGTSANKTVEDRLNEFAADGWELFWVEWRHDDFMRAIFSQPVEAEPQPAPATTETKDG